MKISLKQAIILGFGFTLGRDLFYSVMRAINTASTKAYLKTEEMLNQEDSTDTREE